MIRHPRITMTAVAASPRWIAILAVLTIATAGSRVAVFETRVGRLALVDEWERTALAFGQEVDDVRYAQLRDLSTNAVPYSLGMAVLNGPVLVFVVAAAAFLLFGRVGTANQPRASFTQVCAVVAYASVPLALRQIVASISTYVSETTASATSIGTWWSSLNEASATARFAGALDIFVIWWVVLLAIGIGVLYQRRTGRLAMTLLAAYAGLALALAGTMTMLGGTT
ncbi:MAG TPA: YIP1 family protein [Vicinamibacterales bacterium]